MRFAYFAVLNGTGHMFIGNHFFQGDDENQGLRVAGVMLTNINTKTLFTGNYPALTAKPEILGALRP